jgi:hypothetical protein
MKADTVELLALFDRDIRYLIPISAELQVERG